MELMTLKPLLASKLNVSGFSPMHLALQNNHIPLVRGFVALDSSLVRIKGRRRITPLHHVAQIGDAELLSGALVSLSFFHRRFVRRLCTLLWRTNSLWHLRFYWDGSREQTGRKSWTGRMKMVLKLLHRTVNVKAKNLDGKTAMDILQTHQSPCFPEARRLLHSVKEKLL
ncbi:hypothetical protein IGI04_035523 [Brassica rapa subsp. trilocularis]|nr:uncharacterized protein LOC103833957 [Brassica rapa]XP_048596356.1 uncharacterized protein LOC125578110 [Brassica napus]KAG5384053.1 hypothetical protein IGI04_035523 [Brassica rapa subsp. trilocularis]